MNLSYSDLTKLLYDELHNSTWRLHDDGTQLDKAKRLAAKIIVMAGGASARGLSVETFKSRWVTFTEVNKGERKTRVFRVYTEHSGILLGEIKWWGAFRSYSFFPARDCAFDTEGLEDIKAFIGLLSEERKKQRAEKERQNFSS